MPPWRFLVTTLLTVGLSSAGFALLHFNLVGFGYTFFILVPLCIGYFLGQQPLGRAALAGSLTVGLVSFFYLLFTAQLEGLFCIITLSPLIIAVMAAGVWIGSSVRDAVDRSRDDRRSRLQLNLYPLLILLFSGTAEHYFSSRYDWEEVRSVVRLPYPPETVFDYIKSVDTINTRKPLLLHLGLSVPQKCVLEADSPGAARVCYFREGTIDERVVRIERGKILQMEVTRYGLPGRKWLKFKDATYLFDPEGLHGTRLTRITTYRTELKPRFYWRFWERAAIEAEHQYVLDDLRRRLDAGR